MLALAQARAKLTLMTTWKNDSVGQAELLHRVFGEDPEPVGPPLSELLNYNRRDEERAQRRMFELQKQEEIRQSRSAA